MGFRPKLVIGFFCLGVPLFLLIYSQGGGQINKWTLINNPPPPGPILCFGDSLVAGVGAENPDLTYPAQLAQLLAMPVEALGFPGMTAEEGYQKFAENKQFRGAVVIVTLGGNDILKQVPWETTEASLRKLFNMIQERKGLAVLTGVEAPLLGDRGTKYLEICKEAGVIYVPDVLRGILTNSDLQADQIHPNGAGYKLMAERVASVVATFLSVRKS